MRKLLTIAVATVMAYGALGSSLAAAQGAPKGARKPRGVITLAEITITGRIQKPIAAVDVARLRPQLTLSELRQPFLDRIGKAVTKDPF